MAALTKPDVAAELQVSTRTVSRLIASGELAAFRVGRQVRVRDVDLRRFVAEQVKYRGPAPRNQVGVSTAVPTPRLGRLWD